MSNRDSSAIGRAWRSHNVGRDDSAIEAFRKLLAESPDDLDLLDGLGMALRGGGQQQEAVEVFTRILESLKKQTAQSEDEGNRLEMLRRMTQQQIEFAKE